MIVRELITKLGFDVEHSKFQQFDRQVGILGNKLNQVDQNVLRIADNIGRLGRRMALFVSLPLALAGAGAVKVASTMEQLEISFEVMLGNAEKGTKMMKDLFQFAAKTPFEIKNIGPTAKQLLGMGIESNKLISTLRSLGNVSAGLNVPLARLALNFGQVKAQGKLTGRELRDFAVAGVPLLDELSKITGRSKAEVTKMISAGKIGFPLVEEAFRRMSSEGGRFANLMERMSDTMGGIFSNFLDNVYLVLGALGQEIIESLKLKEAFKKLNDILASVLEKFQGLSASTKRFIIFTALFLIALGPVLMGLAAVIKLFAFMHTALILLKAGFFAASAGAGVFNASMLLVPILILLAVAAFALFVEDVMTWVAGGDSLTGKLLGPFEDWKNGLKMILKSMSDFLDEFFLGIFTGDFNNFIKQLDNFKQTLRFFVKDVLDDLKKLEDNPILKLLFFGPAAGLITPENIERLEKVMGAGIRGIEKTAEVAGGLSMGVMPIPRGLVPRPARVEGNTITLNTSLSIQPVPGSTGTEMGKEAAENFLSEFNRQVRHALSTSAPVEEEIEE